MSSVAAIDFMSSTSAFDSAFDKISDQVSDLYDQCNAFVRGGYNDFFANAGAKEEFRMSLAIGLEALLVGPSRATRIAQCANAAITDVAIYFGHHTALKAVLGSDFDACAACKRAYLPFNMLECDSWPALVDRDDENYNGQLADRRVVVGSLERMKWDDSSERFVREIWNEDKLVHAICSDCYWQFVAVESDADDDVPNGELTEEDEADRREQAALMWDELDELAPVEDFE